MVLVTSYRYLQKPGRNGAFKTFTPLRAVGLSLEQGWKASRDKGLGSVTTKDFCVVKLSGKLKVQSGEQWQETTACTLQLRKQDTALAASVLRKQRALPTDLELNAWGVDKGGAGRQGSFDVFADFSTSRNFGVKGRLWLELKVLADSTWDTELAYCKKELEAKWAKEQKKDSTLGGVLLLAAKVGTCTGGAWSAPTLFAALQKRGWPPGKWQVLAGGPERSGRGRCQGTKPSLAVLWSKMEWPLEKKDTKQKGTKVGLLSQYLKAFGLPGKNPGQRATTFNALLKKHSCKGKVYKGTLKGKCGSKPWVATKQTFRELYTHL